MADDWTDYIHAAVDAKRQPQPAVNGINGRHGGGDNHRYQKLLQRECDKLAATPKGRNSQLNESAFDLAGFVAAGHLTRQEVESALTDAGRRASTLGDHPFTDQEIRATLNSAFTSPNVTPKTLPERHNGHVIEVAPEGFAGHTNGQVTDLGDIVGAEEGFWDSRESLHTIYAAALGRMCAPWAVLAQCAARALTIVRPCITLPPLIGGKGSLNWFAAVAAPSGGGKGSASAAGRDLVDHPVRERGLGSGEGIIGAYHKPGTKDTPPEDHEAVMFNADEIDTVTALGSRTGSTMMGILRSGFAGETLGFSYIAKGRDVHIPAHTYRMTIVISVQPARAGALLGDHGGGTPQRFMWFPGVDPRITDTPGTRPLSPLVLPSPREWLYPKVLTIPREAERLILAERAKSGRGEQAAMDGHAVFCREKFAYALTVLDGRTDMTAEDWELSGVAAEVSGRTRRWVVDGLSSADEESAVERGRIRGVELVASDEEKAYRADQRADRMARWVVKKLGDGPLTNRELHRAVAGRDRPWLGSVLQGLVNAGTVGLDADKRWVKL